MRVVGIDPSSSCLGVALVVDEKRLVETADWKPRKSGSAPARLTECYIWLMGWLLHAQPDIACVEFLSVERNAQTTRVVSHYQAISVLACKMRGVAVIEARVSEARKSALGRGNMSKEEAWKEVRDRYPDHDWPRADQGGYDQADATVLAVAGPSIIEG